MTEIAWHPSHTDLEKLFVNNSDLDKLEAYLNRFNPIRVMRMERMEVRHSNILGWLLDPLESHTLGDRFLKAFLAEALKGDKAQRRPTALDIIQADLRDMEVRREWQHIDLFLLSRRNDWAFIIENKYHSLQHSGQLARYMEKVRAAFEPQEGKLDIRGIFLTLRGDPPDDTSYATISYDDICDILPRVIEAEGQALGQQVRIFIEHYIEVIGEATDMSDEQKQMEQLARSLYRNHRKVLDFIVDHGSSTDLQIACDEIFGDGWTDGRVADVENGRFVGLTRNRSQIGFLPFSWYEALGSKKYHWPGCNNWWAGFPLICWFELNAVGRGSVRLIAEVGPVENFECRKRLIEAIQAVSRRENLVQISFRDDAPTEGKKYSRFFKKNSIAINDVQDVEELSRAITTLLGRFKSCFDAIAPVLGDFVKYAEKKGE